MAIWADLDGASRHAFVELHPQARRSSESEQDAAKRVRRYDYHFKKIVVGRFGRMPSIPEWLALPKISRQLIYREAERLAAQH